MLEIPVILESVKRESFHLSSHIRFFVTTELLSTVFCGHIFTSLFIVTLLPTTTLLPINTFSLILQLGFIFTLLHTTTLLIRVFSSITVLFHIIESLITAPG